MDQTTRQETLKAVLHYFFQENTRAGSHCRYSLQYHLVWIPKYRRSFLVGAIAERLLTFPLCCFGQLSCWFPKRTA